jgi:hypothetical protein
MDHSNDCHSQFGATVLFMLKKSMHWILGSLFLCLHHHSISPTNLSRTGCTHRLNFLHKRSESVRAHRCTLFLQYVSSNTHIGLDLGSLHSVYGPCRLVCPCLYCIVLHCTSLVCHNCCCLLDKTWTGQPLRETILGDFV